MKKPIHSLLRAVLLLLVIAFSLINLAKAQQSVIQVKGWNAYVHLPAGYTTSTKSYPTIIFFPGEGEVGTVADSVIVNGPGAYITQGWNGNVVVGVDTVQFIVISLQPPAAYPAEPTTLSEIQGLESLYRIDKTNLFLTGLSEGGWCCTTFVTYDPLGGPYTYASQVKAIVNVEGVIPSDNQPFPYLFQNYAKAGGKLCNFEQVDDGRDMPAYTDEMDSTVPGSALLTETDFGTGGHCCWASFFGGQGTSPGIFTLDGIPQTIYQWLARIALGQTNTNVTPPTVNAGNDQTIIAPNSSVTLNGSAVDTEGTIVSYQWAQISGPSTATITNATSSSTTVTGLVQGSYDFSLTVTDDLGAVGADTVQVTVSILDLPPVANAGGGVAVTLPTNTAILNGSATDVDGTIVSYLWKQLSGPSTATISSASSAVPTVGNLILGQYSFSMKVTDNNGATDTDTTWVTVNPALLCNTNPPHIFTFTSNGSTSDIYQLDLPAKGGDTIKIYAGNYTDVIEFDSLSGDPCNPITIINVGGQVSTATIRIKSGCQYVHLTGSGDPNTTYGFKCLLGPLGMDYGNHIEYDHIEIIDTAGVGMFMKPIPDTTNPYTYYGHGGMNYVTTKIHIHDNYIHNTGGEGMYIGPSNPDGGDNQIGSGTWPDGSQILPARLDSIEIDHNILDSVGWTGIQLSNARYNALIHDNILNHPGCKNVGDHQTGIILGGNTNGSIYNNHIQDVTGNGIQTFGFGAINIYSNFVDSAGRDGTAQGQEILFTNDIPTVSQPGPPQQIVAYNNTFNHPMPAAAIRVGAYNNNSLPSNVYNNEFCIPGAAANWQSTYLILNVAGSINSNNVLYCGPVVSTPVANAGPDTTITLPISSLTLNGSGTEINGLITGYSWAEASGPSTTTIQNSKTASALVLGFTAGVYKFVLTVTDSSGLTATDTMKVTVNATLPAPVISSSLAANGTLGSSFSYTITASNNPTSYGATGLPAGLSVNTSTGVISGTPTVVGISDVTISATNSEGTGTTTLVITVINSSSIIPVISSSNVANATTGAAFSYDIIASNTPTSYGASNLPTGLSVNTSTGLISGTPTKAGVYNVTITATNSAGSATETVVITINPPAPVISSALTASGTIGKSFSYSITASNTPTSYAATSLPIGLGVNTSTGDISGTPTVSGTYNVTISATNAGGSSTKTLVVTINAAIPSAPVITSLLTATGKEDSAFSYAIIASNSPTSYTATGLPSGLSVNTSTGIISGTPISNGIFNVSISAINAGGTATKVLVITINLPAPVISGNISATGTKGIAFSYSIIASNNPTSYEATGLPAGLTVNASTGLINGTPTKAGVYDVTVSAGNVSGTGTQTIVIIINPPAPIISSSIAITGTKGIAINYRITASNNPTSYAATGLPSGLSVNTSTGAISGTPTVNGTFNVTISATNAGGTGTKVLVITINTPIPNAPVITSASTATGTLYVAFNYTIIASNSPTSYGAINLPTGLSINTLTGIISGTPTIAGTFNVTISATNPGGTTTTTLVIIINTPVPIISGSTTASGTIGSAFSYAIAAFNTPTSYGATGLPSGLSIDTTMGLISGVPAKSGIFDVTISATNAGGTATATLVITITAPVVVNAGTNQVIILPVNTVTLSGTATDGGASISSYDWVKISGPSSGTITSASSASTTVSNLTAGVYQFELIVTNSLGATGKDTVQVTVNTHPVANAGVDESITLPVNTVTLSGSGTDAGGTISSYQWAKVSGPTTGTITNTSSATTTVTGLVQGVYKFVLTVTDNFGLSNSDTVSVTVNAANINQSNTPPVANAGADQLIILPVNTVTLSGSASDKDASIVSYKWTKLSGPSAGAITTATSASTTVTGLTAGIYQFVITVTDSKGLTGKDTVQIIVHTPPVANAGADQIINYPASTVTLSGSATDADGTIVSYQWTKLSGPSTVTITNASSAGTTVTGLTAGVYQFVLTVTDNDGATGKDTMEVTVNTPPVVNAGTNITITLPVSTVTLSGSATDATGTVVSYLWSQIAGPVSASIVGAASNSTSVTGLTTKGTYQFVLTVKNNSGQTGKDTITVTVLKHVSLPPVANAGSDITISLPTNTVALSGSATDSGGTVVSYHWSQVSGPSASTITDSTTAQASVSNLEEGVYEYELTVMNNDSLTATATMTVTVTASSKLTMKVLAGPNPVQSTLTVQVSNLSETNQKLLVTLTSVSGATVYSSVVPAGQSTVDTKINMGSFGTGIYFLKVYNESDGQSISKEIFKN